jgi:hypothetical protein
MTTKAKMDTLFSAAKMDTHKLGSLFIFKQNWAPCCQWQPTFSPGPLPAHSGPPKGLAHSGLPPILMN